MPAPAHRAPRLGIGLRTESDGACGGRRQPECDRICQVAIPDRHRRRCKVRKRAVGSQVLCQAEPTAGRLEARRGVALGPEPAEAGHQREPDDQTEPEERTDRIAVAPRALLRWEHGDRTCRQTGRDEGRNADEQRDAGAPSRPRQATRPRIVDDRPLELVEPSIALVLGAGGQRFARHDAVMSEAPHMSEDLPLVRRKVRRFRTRDHDLVMARPGGPETDNLAGREIDERGRQRLAADLPSVAQQVNNGRGLRAADLEARGLRFRPSRPRRHDQGEHQQAPQRRAGPGRHAERQRKCVQVRRQCHGQRTS